MRGHNAELSRPGSERISLKAFWEAVEERLAACSADELRAIQRSLAQATPPAQRGALLDQLKPAKGPSAAIQKKLRPDEIRHRRENEPKRAAFAKGIGT
jgi:hypothetical protein